MTLYKGHNSVKGDNPDKKKRGQLFYDAESIYEISKPYLKFVKDGQAQSNMPLQLFQSRGHKKGPRMTSLFELDLYLMMLYPFVNFE